MQGLKFFIIFVVLVTIHSQPRSEDLRERIIDHHFKFLPAGEGPFPTILIIPGCSGISLQDPKAEAEHPLLRDDDRLFRRHYLKMAERLKTEGFAVLLIHIHAAEGLLTACNGELKASLIAQYIDESVAWARELKFVDAQRLHLIGWSMGGGGVLAWLQGGQSQSGRVSSVIAIYPGCSELNPIMDQTPLLVQLADADDIAKPETCENLINSSRVKPAITISHYEKARHGFDIVDAPAKLDIGNGMSIGYQKNAAQKSWKEVLAYLKSITF